MTPRRIQIELRERGITQNALAQKMKVSPVTISRVIHRHVVSRRLMFGIAAEIQADIREVFPEYYDLPETEEDDAEGSDRKAA
jgi:transcriptional regulator with XRE-family HTH domain